MNKTPRRIVTGIENGKSTTIEDQQIENVVEHFPGLIISDIWTRIKVLKSHSVSPSFFQL